MKSEVEKLKEEGNEAVKKENYLEAVIHYTHAIKLDPQNHLLYSNRSLAFLKVQQYFLALEDAKQTIQLQPNWPKGFFRKGEVEFHCKKYTEALVSYKKALILDSSDTKVKEAITKANRELTKERKADARQPYKFTGIASLIGIVIVLADQYVAKEPSIQNVILQVLLVIVFGILGFLGAQMYRSMVAYQKSSLLEAPVDLLEGMNGTSQTDRVKEETPKDAGKHPKKGGVSAARQRYKQGRS